MSEETSTVFRALAEPIESTGDGLTLEGYAAVFNRRTHIVDHLGEYDEVIRQGAFARSINARTPFLMYQHGRHPVFGQFPLGKIEELREDSNGLFVKARLVDTPFTAPVRDAIRDGAITGMSVAMESPRGKAAWTTERDGTKLRTVNEAKLYELGPVLGPVYEDTAVAVRSIDAAFRSVFPDAFAEDEDSEFAARVRAEVAAALAELAPSAETRDGEETDTPDGPAEAGTPDGPVEDTDVLTEPSTFAQRQQRARLISAGRRGIRE